MSLVSLANAQARVGDSVTQEMIDGVEEWLAGEIGPLTGDRTETFYLSERRNLNIVDGLWLSRRTDEVELTNDGDALTLDTDFRLINGILVQHISTGESWGDTIVATYTPTDSDQVTEAIYDLHTVRTTQHNLQSIRRDLRHRGHDYAGRHLHSGPDQARGPSRTLREPLPLPAIPGGPDLRREHRFVSAFMALLNRSLAVTGLTDTGQTDGGGNPIYSNTAKGTVKGRIDPKVRPDEVNGPDVNPVISEYLAVTAMPVGFTISERDTMTSDSEVFEVLGLAIMDGRTAPHHLEIDLRKIIA
jgi:hypothetical protein